MLNWLKRLVAGRELAELDRWRVEFEQAERWLAEFPDVAMALGNIRRSIAGNEMFYDMPALRDRMRMRRDNERKFDEALGVLTVPPARDKATIGRLAGCLASLRFHPTNLVADPADAPADASDRIAYRFLGAESDEG